MSMLMQIIFNFIFSINEFNEYKVLQIGSKLEPYFLPTPKEL